MATDISQLGYSTFVDIINNYSSADAGAKFVMPTRVLDRMTPLVRMLPMKASNNILSNIAVRTDSLPVASTRLWNQGIQPTSAKNTPLNDPIALFEDYSEVDKDLWEIQNDPNMWRADQDMNHIEGLFQLMESTLFYGQLATNLGAFNGLATRFNNLESYPNGDQSWQPNVWNGGLTTGNATSAWMIEFGEDTVYGIYPPNTMAGLSVRDLGEVTKETSASTGAGPSLNYLYQVLRTMLRWYMGIQIADERAVQRIANINPTALSSPGDFDENIFIEAKNWLPRNGEGSGTVIFVNRQLKQQIDIRAVSQKLNAYTYFNSNETDVFGRSVTKFQNIPIYVCEKILATETVVS